VALDTVYLCRISFPRLSLLATRMPGLQARLFSLLSAEIGKVATLAANHRTEERMAAFLLDLSERYARRGFSATRFNLSMARTEIANYLRMAPETVSRVLRRLSDEGVIAVNQREMLLLHPSGWRNWPWPGTRTGLIRQGADMKRADCCCWACWPRYRPGRPT
jgi:CRP/FNR family transcriptional regulator